MCGLFWLISICKIPFSSQNADPAFKVALFQGVLFLIIEAMDVWLCPALPETTVLALLGIRYKFYFRKPFCVVEDVFVALLLLSV